jgi:hypothetical protein
MVIHNSQQTINPMRLVLYGLVMIGCVLLLCSCSSGPQLTPTEAEMIREELDTPSISTSIRPLLCTTHIETTWGDKTGEFGLCPTSSEQVRYPYSPVFNTQGDLFILDVVNQRILRYMGSKSPLVIPLSPPYKPHDPCSYSTRGLSNLGIYSDRLFLSFSAFSDERSIEYLAVLSLEGQEEHIISLEAYYPMYPRSAPIADGQGGAYVLLPPDNVVYFDDHFKSEFMFLGADEVGGNGLTIGWDNNLYTYSADHDELTYWGAGNNRFRHGEPLKRKTNVISTIQITATTWKRLLGVDAQGNIYFKIGIDEQHVGYRFVRLSSSGNEVIIATVPAGVLDTGSSPAFSLAPDGSLYGMSYGLMTPDPTFNPRVIKCTFDE